MSECSLVMASTGHGGARRGTYVFSGDSTVFIRREASSVAAAPIATGGMGASAP
jgi:hypothetical protein